MSPHLVSACWRLAPWALFLRFEMLITDPLPNPLCLLLSFPLAPGAQVWPSHQSRQQSKNSFKVVFLGKSGVGKTSVTLRFCRDMFLDGTEATIGYVYNTFLGDSLVMQRIGG